MTVNTTNITSGPYQGNGVTDTFSYTFRITDKSQTRVYEIDDSGNETLLTVDADYTVNNTDDDDGGTITLLNGPLPINHKLFMRADYKYNQLTSFTSQSAFFPDVHENALDKLTFLIQQILDLRSRSPSLPDTYPIDGQLSLPEPIALSFIRWKSDLSGFENVTAAEINVEDITLNEILLTYSSVAEMQSSSPANGGLINYTIGQALRVQDVVNGTDDFKVTSGPNGVALGGGLWAKKINPSEGGINEKTVFNANNTPPLGPTPSQIEEVFGIIHTGQSLAEGGVGNRPAVAVSPINHNCMMLRNGPVGVASEALSIRMQPLSEKARVTIANTMCDRLISNGLCDKTFFSGQAWGGKSYAELKKGAALGVFESCISQVTSINNINSEVDYRVITVIHGEQDGISGNTNYANDLVEWRTDFNTDIKAITGQTHDLDLFLCQTASGGGYGNNGGIGETTFPSPLQQLVAHKNNSNIIMVASKYQYEYVDQSHIDNKSQSIHGEKYGQAISHHLNSDLGDWEPLRPLSFDKLSNTVVITFTGSILSKEYPLAFDVSNVESITNMGFSYTDDSANTITSVDITDWNKVTITLSGLVGSNPIIAYAYHNGAGGSTNQANGLGDRGNLRDSDPLISKIDGSRLYNWCVIFRESI